MDKFLLPAELGQAILNYLVTKPYNEVATLVSQLAQLAPVVPPPEPPPPTDEIL